MQLTDEQKQQIERVVHAAISDICDAMVDADNLETPIDIVTAFALTAVGQAVFAVNAPDRVRASSQPETVWEDVCEVAIGVWEGMKEDVFKTEPSGQTEEVSEPAK